LSGACGVSASGAGVGVVGLGVGGVVMVDGFLDVVVEFGDLLAPVCSFEVGVGGGGGWAGLVGWLGGCGVCCESEGLECVVELVE
jgi:hypothetical protein